MSVKMEIKISEKDFDTIEDFAKERGEKIKPELHLGIMIIAQKIRDGAYDKDIQKFLREATKK